MARAPVPAGHLVAVRRGTTRRRAGRTPRAPRRPGTTSGGRPGASWRMRISRRVKASSSCCSEPRSQSYQEISESWHQPLLLPPWERPELVAAEQHRGPVGQNERGEEVADLAHAQRVDLRVVRRPLDAAVPGAVVVRPVPVVLVVGLVVLLVVGDEIAQREAVVGGDEVDRRERVAAVGLVQVRGAGEARRERVRPGLAAPEVAHRVPVDAVPLAPQDREVADLVAARADVPRLGDQLDLGQDGVLVDRVEERARAVHVVELAGQGAGARSKRKPSTWHSITQ